MSPAWPTALGMTTLGYDPFLSDEMASRFQVRLTDSGRDIRGVGLYYAPYAVDGGHAASDFGGVTGEM